MSTSNVATEAELQAWLDEQDAQAKAEAASRKQAERAALKFNFEHAKLKSYAAAVGAWDNETHVLPPTPTH